ncbi:MAG: helix-turn-helix domain-containing protein [Candidatus Woesearchaeota archaeon]
MIVQKTFLNKLRDFGLNTYESKLWTALLSRGISTAGELSDISNVPRSRTYDVLETLEKKGFIIMKIGKPIKYIAVSPDEVIKRVKKKIQEESEYKNQLMEQLESSEVLDELTLLHNKGVDLVEPTDLSGLFKGRENIYTHFESMVRKAKKSIIIMTTPSDLIRKAESFHTSFKKANEKGVLIRVCAPLTKDHIKRLKRLSDIAEIRISKIDSRLVIIDDSELLIMIMDDKKVHSSYDTSIWINTKFIGKSLVYLFDKEWDTLQSINQ